MAKRGPGGIELNDGDEGDGSERASVAGGGENGERRIVPKHRQCPLCYSGQNNGVGKVYATRGAKQYRKCDRCSFTFVTPTDPTEAVHVERRDVELRKR